MSSTPLLNTVQLPQDLRGFTSEQLKQLAQELRADLIASVAQTGGHLGAGLGVVELTIALHHVFDTPHDKLVWDVGHQTYPHKILTGRRGLMQTLRQPGGLSGFCKRSESPYDTFGAGHSSTSISAALGMAVARDLQRAHGLGEPHEVIAVIGDGAMSAGMAYEALNNAGALGTRLIVILNDNDMSIAPPVGAMSAYLSRLISSHPYRSFRHMAKSVAGKLPSPLMRAAKHAEKSVLGLAGAPPSGGRLFEELGFYYVGPVDGHNLDHLLPVLKNLRDDKENGPVLLHVVTQKGYGYAPAEASDDKFHGVVSFDVTTGAQKKSTPRALSYTEAYSKALIREAEDDDSIVAITAAMPSGTGLDAFAARFPERMFDVGIAEQHAVTFAAGLAVAGYAPFVTIYSTFLQRAYDQVVHDVAVQCLPVRFAIDRAGLVGADGPTHAGIFDIAYLANLPNFVVMAAADESELTHMVATLAQIHDRPSALRYPRGEGTGVALPARGTPLPIGKGRMLREGTDVAILSLGTRLHAALAAADVLEAQGISVSVADARFAKPFDTMLIDRLLARHRLLVTVEEGASGGFGAHVLEYVAGREEACTTPIRCLHLPDRFLEQGLQAQLYAEAGLNAEGIALRIQNSLQPRAAFTA